jgi:23S rRNA (cytosine1962-C5)-methyltransferase
MSQPANITLKRGEAERIAAGHPWIYAGNIATVSENPMDGDVVQVKDAKNRLLGLGFFNSQSRIRVRMLTRQRRPIDDAFFRERINAALAVRQRHLPGATSHRVINAEGDFLSGLIVDRYNDTLVLQTSSLGMDRRKREIVGVLRELLGPTAIVERNDIASRKFEGLEPVTGMLHGNPPGRITMRVNNLDFEIDPLSGHKTGAYLDQQGNYQAVSDLVANYPRARVLDCFSFHGGFALHAAKNEGTRVTAIDQSEEAVTTARANAARNGLADRCEFLAANAFDWLKKNTAKDQTDPPAFDCVILDPPSFTRNRASVGDALRGYKEIHVRALRLLKPGGLLASFCCSHHVERDLFENVILEAAYDTRKTLRRVATYTQSPDHPVIPVIPETEYLKGFAFELA